MLIFYIRILEVLCAHFISQRRDLEESQSAWRSLMLYYGGLTFYPEDPAHNLIIPNAIAAKRIARAVLEKYGLRESFTAALESFLRDGNIRPVLSCYRDLMIQRDVGINDYKANETLHRDSFYFSLIRNHILCPEPEYQLTKVRQLSYNSGQI